MAEPVYALNNYIWKLLQEKESWNPSDYNGRNPIIPASQQPEFNSYGAPFIVYGWTTESPSTFYAENVCVIAYTVYGKTASEVNGAISVMNKALRRIDESANDINAWLHDADNPLHDSFEDTMIRWTRVASTQSSGPAASEGGRVDGYLLCRMAYMQDAQRGEFKLS